MKIITIDCEICMSKDKGGAHHAACRKGRRGSGAGYAIKIIKVCVCVCVCACGAALSLDS